MPSTASAKIINLSSPVKFRMVFSPKMGKPTNLKEVWLAGMGSPMKKLILPLGYYGEKIERGKPPITDLRELSIASPLRGRKGCPAKL